MKKLTVIIILIMGAMSLNSFRPLQHHFVNDYQYSLYLSWLHRGGFGDEGPALLSQHNIIITFINRETNQEAVVEFDLDMGKIAIQIERIPVIETTDERLERSYRYYLEQLLQRLNSSHTFFVTDFAEQFNLKLKLGAITDTDSIAVYLQTAINERLTITSGKFSKIDSESYLYDLTLNGRLQLQVFFQRQNNLLQLSRSLRAEERESDKIADIDFPPQPEYRVASYYMPIVTEPVPSRPVLPKITEDLKISDFIKTYRDLHWSRELLHNKIGNRDAFIKAEFPDHRLLNNGKEFELTIDKFQGQFSGNLHLTERILRDGVLFTSSNRFTLDNDKQVTLATGETISLAELTDDDIEIVAPFMNQLVTMHRVVGTKLLNFLLIPADVPTTLVIRDPERDVMEFESYTDLLLMLSYYWLERNIYFSIESVKKVNNHIEFTGMLAAHNQKQQHFDFAEIRFSLNPFYRIDLAMVVLHSGVIME